MCRSISAATMDKERRSGSSSAQGSRRHYETGNNFLVRHDAQLHGDVGKRGGMVSPVNHWTAAIALVAAEAAIVAVVPDSGPFDEHSLALGFLHSHHCPVNSDCP